MPRLHVLAAALAMAIIATFWTTTVATELLLSQAAVITLKTTLPWGFLVLIPAMATAGVTGTKLARGRSGGLLGTKLGRMKFVAANGALVLVPSALALAWLASRADFGWPFYAIQAVELMAGATNLTLLALNMRDGRKLTAARRRRAEVRA